MGADLNQFVLATDPTNPTLAHRAAVRLADHVASKHPHPLDDRYPALAGTAIAKDPAVRGELLDLLGALGLTKTKPRRRK
ncbi:hypothetical protein [Streptomyces kaempferi]|uniref:Uncharacterized protein n=1 Tax=Streptomyces kaempferi TaxID=333725 RepID=A0ABW3XDC4_9ACTN